MIVIYFNPDCSKCQSTLCLLEQSKKQYEKIEYLKTSLSRKELEDIIKMLDIEPYELIRKQEPIFIQNFPNHILSAEESISAMLEFPVLIERPIVVIHGKAIICRPPEKLWDILKNIG